MDLINISNSAEERTCLDSLQTQESSDDNFSTSEMNWSDEVFKWCKNQSLCQSTESLARLLLEQLKEQHLQIAEMRANEARQWSGIEDIRRSYDKELVRLQTLLTKRWAPNQPAAVSTETRSNISLNDSSREVERSEAENHPPNDLKCATKNTELEKEIALQNHLIEGFQRENEVLMKENKELKQKLASTLIPSEDANAIAERLVHENARLQIDFQQVKDELKALRSSQNLRSKKENSAHDMEGELEQALRRLEEESRLNGGLRDSLRKSEAELKQTKEENLRLQKLLSTTNSKWSEEVKDRQRRIVTLNTELKRVRQDYVAAMQRVQEKMRWQNYSQSVSSRHLSTIKKQKLEIMKLKVELAKKQNVTSSERKVVKHFSDAVTVSTQTDYIPISIAETQTAIASNDLGSGVTAAGMEIDHDFATGKDNRRYSALVRELQVELRASIQRANRLETQLNTLSRVHMAVITGRSPNEALKWNSGVRERNFKLEVNLDAGGSVDMEDGSSASYWRSIAGKRTNEVAVLSREVDKLTNLLEEISTRKSLTAG